MLRVHVSMETGAGLRGGTDSVGLVRDGCGVLEHGSWEAAQNYWTGWALGYGSGIGTGGAGKSLRFGGVRES